MLVLTTFDLDEYVFEALRAGASGFLLKDAPPEELVARRPGGRRRRRAVGPGGHPAADRAVRRPALARAADAAALERADRARDRGAAAGRPGLSNAEIAAELVVSEATVKTHVGHVLTKLGLRDRVQAVVLAYETGFVQPGSA